MPCVNSTCTSASGAIDESALKRCSRCKQATYCSAACQKQHWSTHKLQCKSKNTKSGAAAAAAKIEWFGETDAVELAPSRTCDGYGVRAKRRMEVGEVIWNEAAVIALSESSKDTEKAALLAKYNHLDEPAATPSPAAPSSAPASAATATSASTAGDAAGGSGGDGDGKKVLSLFSRLITSRLNHGCTPNVYIAWSRTEEGAPTMVKARVIKPVPAGAELFTSYIDPCNTRSTRQVATATFLPRTHGRHGRHARTPYRITNMLRTHTRSPKTH